MQRRRLLRLASLALGERLAAVAAAGRRPVHKVVLVTLGGIRRRESFSPEGLPNIPHLFEDLLPQSLFYNRVHNEGVTAHFNTIASILTGTWQHLDDWGREAPRQPTLFQYVQKQLGVSAAETWVVTSNKALTSNIGVGANVVLAKQLLVEAVERIILGSSPRKRLERELLLDELVAVMQDDFERIGWRLPSPSGGLDPALRKTFLAGLAGYIRGPDSPASGDELTFFMASEVLRRVSPALLMVNLSDVEVAHSGTYSLHLAGIRRVDGLCHRLWQLLQSLPDYRGRTTMVIMPEFGRDPDGSSTNGFFNHRSDHESCRLSWAMVLGRGIRPGQWVERPIRQIDLAPSLGVLLGLECEQAEGHRLEEFAA